MSEEEKGSSSENEGGSSEEEVELSDDEIARVPLLGDDSTPNEIPSEKLKELISKQKSKNEPPQTETAADTSKSSKTKSNAIINTNNTESTLNQVDSQSNPDNNNKNDENKNTEDEVDEDECFPVDAPVRHHVRDDILNQISENDLLKIADRQLSLLDLDYQQCINCQKRKNNVEEINLESQDESVVERNPYAENYTPIGQINSDDDDNEEEEDNGEVDNLFDNDPNYIRKPHKPLENDTNTKIKDIINTLPPPKYPKWVENLNIDKVTKLAVEQQEPPPVASTTAENAIPPAVSTNQSNLNDYDILPPNPGTKSNKKGKRKNKKKSHKK